MTAAGQCPVCGGVSRERLRGLFSCSACGLGFTTDRSFAEPVYAAGLEDGIYGSAKDGIFSSALDSLEKTIPGLGRLLDIGCASGVFLKAAAGRGWKAEGVELSEKLAARARENGFAVSALPVEKAGLEAEAYDAVTAFEVFSQMYDPAAAAREIFRIMKPGGTLCVREFNAAFHLPLYALELRGFFEPLGLKPSVIHNFNFTAASLRRMLERAGFRDIEISNSPLTAGDPYRTGGRLGGFLTSLFKVLYYLLAQAVRGVTFGKILAGSTLIVTARK